MKRLLCFFHVPLAIIAVLVLVMPTNETLANELADQADRNLSATTLVVQTAPAPSGIAQTVTLDGRLYTKNATIKTPTLSWASGVLNLTDISDGYRFLGGSDQAKNTDSPVKIIAASAKFNGTIAGGTSSKQYNLYSNVAAKNAETKVEVAMRLVIYGNYPGGWDGKIFNSYPSFGPYPLRA